MSVRRRAPWLLVLLVVALATGGCSAIGLGATPQDAAWLGGPGQELGEAGSGPVRLLWAKELVTDGPREGAYMPVQTSAAALDPGRDRLYVGTTHGKLVALDASGRERYEYDAEAPIEAPPVVDPRRNEVYAVGRDGVVHALRAYGGELRWKETVGDTVRETPVLTDDAVYVVTDTDLVVALDRRDGSLLWSYRRDAPEGFAIAGRAGLALSDDHLVTGFTDGAVVCLDPADGSLQWELETAVDIEAPEGGAPRFLDVDTTPVIAGDTVYVASFAAGVYGLDLRSGTVRWHEGEHTGVIGMAVSGRRLVLASADHGVVALDRGTREVLWRRGLERGAPGEPVISGDTVLFGETQGSLIALSLTTGRETARIEAGHGFTSAPTVSGGLGFALSNAGQLYSFTVDR